MIGTRKAQELDVVELIEDLPEFGLKRGDRGAVIAAFEEPSEAYDLEIVDESGASKFAYAVKPEQLVNIDAVAQDAYVNGVELLRLGARFEGRRKLREAVRLKPVIARYLLNAVLESFGTSENFDGLIDALQFVCQLNPTDELPRKNLVSAYLNRAIQQARNGDVEGALQLFYPAMAMATSDETRSWVRQNLAAAHTELAIEAHRRARAELNPEEALKQLKNGLTGMVRACSIDPNERTRTNVGRAYANMANWLTKNRRFLEAVEFFRVAEDIGVSFPEFHNNFGVARAFSGDLEGAVEQFELALELEPTLPSAQSNIVSVQQARKPDETGDFLTEEIRDFQFHELPVSQAYDYQRAAAY